MKDHEQPPDGITHHRRLGHNPRSIQGHQGPEMDSQEQVDDSQESNNQKREAQ